jgi:hypothetical protein
MGPGWHNIFKETFDEIERWGERSRKPSARQKKPDISRNTEEFRKVHQHGFSL